MLHSPHGDAQRGGDFLCAPESVDLLQKKLSTGFVDGIESGGEVFLRVYGNVLIVQKAFRNI